MYESERYKLMSCCFIMQVVIVSYVFFANYWKLYYVALDYNEAAVDGVTYDQCGFINTV